MTTPLGVFTVVACRAPCCIALVNDYDVVVVGLAHLFDGYRDRIVVAELAANKTVVDDVDIVLYDSFAQPEADHDDIEVLIRSPQARRGRRLHVELPSSAHRERDGEGSERLSLEDACRRTSWSTRWRRSTPARSSSAIPRRGREAGPAATGRGGSKG